jgi:very-short-patch-repair endonuclease
MGERERIPPRTWDEVEALEAAAEGGDEIAVAYLNQPYRFATKSPIEAKLAQAIMGAAPYRWIPKVYEPQSDLFVALHPNWMFQFQTQVPIPPYTVDLLLCCHEEVRIVVECDGHDFHEKTAAQAEHDKRRDRFLQAQGYRVLRFTGREIYRSAEAAAEEILKTATRLAQERGAA